MAAEYVMIFSTCSNWFTFRWFAVYNFQVRSFVNCKNGIHRATCLLFLPRSAWTVGAGHKFSPLISVCDEHCGSLLSHHTSTSSVHLLCGLPRPRSPSIIPNLTVFRRRLSDILQMCPNSVNFFLKIMSVNSLSMYTTISTFSIVSPATWHVLPHHFLLSFCQTPLFMCCPHSCACHNFHALPVSNSFNPMCFYYAS